MNDLFKIVIIILFSATPSLIPCKICSGQDPMPSSIEQSFGATIQRAAMQVSPAVVRIETLGGLDFLEDQLLGSGPTTGTIVDQQGYIVTSSFNFASRPSSILVQLADGRRYPAQVVSNDFHRRLTLLKIEAENLPTPKFSSPDSLQVGQSMIAMGRTYRIDQPNLSVGLVSALNRIDGKAIQTDAKISPSNYGGPLVTLSGEVAGILVPLSPGSNSVAGGTEWYDSGIGFAINYHQIQQRLPMMMDGQDIQKGLMGISFDSGAAFLTKPVVKEVRPNSPAEQANLKPLDVITAAQGLSTPTISQLRKVIGQYDAGEEVLLTIQRDSESVETKLILTDELEPFLPGILGIIPSRSRELNSERISIRDCIPGSPAAIAGLQKGDQLLTLNGIKIESLESLRDELSTIPRDNSINLEYLRDGETRRQELQLAEFPQEIPQQVSSSTNLHLDKPHSYPMGEQTISLPGDAGQYYLYTPEDYHPKHQHGVIVWVHVAGRLPNEKEKIALRLMCRSADLVLIAPKKSEVSSWEISDLPFIKECLNDVRVRYPLQSARSILDVVGKENQLFWYFLMENREHLTGLIAHSIPNRMKFPWYHPHQPLRILIPSLPEDVTPDEALIQNIRELGFPITLSSDVSESLEFQQAVTEWIDLQDCL